MKELEKAQQLCLTGAERDKALALFSKQIQAWNLVMPPATPLVADFGLNDFWHTGLIECWIANEEAAGYCGKFLFVFDGQTCPKHAHGVKLETFFIVRGSVQMEYAGAVRQMNPGDVLLVECDQPHRFTGVNGPALLLEVSKPCIVDDNYFENPDIPFGPNYRGKRK